ncbi:hypothetical protein NPIL_238791 [Nephila pilipes]|uniref:Uncharacterized protein n=1 Tax=Nephila pilipes TaxID=299642 RepID=A0A8X6TS97_NEPPI|nr:hypothetical protein NPIL_238791 [Nephila pilipes]
MKKSLKRKEKKNQIKDPLPLMFLRSLISSNFNLGNRLDVESQHDNETFHREEVNSGVASLSYGKSSFFPLKDEHDFNSELRNIQKVKGEEQKKQKQLVSRRSN